MEWALLSGKPNAKRSLKGNSEIDAELPRVEPRVDGNFHGKMFFVGSKSLETPDFGSIFCLGADVCWNDFWKKKQDWFFKPEKNRLRDQHFG